MYFQSKQPKIGGGLKLLQVTVYFNCSRNGMNTNLLQLSEGLSQKIDREESVDEPIDIVDDTGEFHANL